MVTGAVGVIETVIGQAFALGKTPFDLLRGSFDTGGSYDRDIGGVLGALTVGRGFSTDLQPGLGAAKTLVRTLRADGIKVDGATATGTAPDGARQVAQVLSP